MSDLLPETMPLADVKNRLSEVVDDVEKTMHRVTITKHGRPAAVLISVADLEGLLETIDILRDPEEAAAVREAVRELDAGGGEVLSKQEALHRWGSTSA